MYYFLRHHKRVDIIENQLFRSPILHPFRVVVEVYPESHVASGIYRRDVEASSNNLPVWRHEENRELVIQYDGRRWVLMQKNQVIAWTKDTTKPILENSFLQWNWINEIEDLYINLFPEFSLMYDHLENVDSWGETIEYLIMEPLRSNSVNLRIALKEIEEVSCLKFVEISENTPDLWRKEFLLFESGQPGCFSEIGKQQGRPTRVNLELNVCTDPVQIKHVIMHGLGFSHEHQRQDRDLYIKLSENLPNSPGLMNNLRKLEVNDRNRDLDQRLYLPYDYSSIMHFVKFFEPKIGYYKNMLDIARDFSIVDIMSINLKFQCKFPASYHSQFMEYLHHSYYHELKQLDFELNDVASRSFLLYPYRVVIEAELFPYVDGEYRQVLKVHQRPEWKHTKHDNLKITFDEGRWRIVDNLDSNKLIARSQIVTTIMLVKEDWECFYEDFNDWKPCYDIYINLFPDFEMSEQRFN